MADLNSRHEKCEQDIEQLRREVADVIGLVAGVLARVDEALAKVGAANRQMFADLQAQTEAWFASLQRKSTRCRCLFLSARRMIHRN
jgi:hypothetical protein